jgi:hypothetical protein
MPGAIAALLTAPTIAEAARHAGVSTETLFRWLKLPYFKEQLDEAKAQVVTCTVMRLSGLSSDAVQTLSRNLSCGVFNAENRAAIAILDNLRTMAAQQDLEERLVALEKQLAEALAHRNNRRA